MMEQGAITHMQVNTWVRWTVMDTMSAYRYGPERPEPSDEHNDVEEHDPVTNGNCNHVTITLSCDLIFY